MPNTLKVVLFGASFFLGSVVWSHPGHPPEAAFSVCAQKAMGQSCSFNTPRRTVNGLCHQPPRETRLVCVPQRGQAPGYGDSHEPKPRHEARSHTVVQSSGFPNRAAATKSPITQSLVNIFIRGDKRVIEANGVAAHATGVFPNQGNPHTIEAQRYVYRVVAKPELASRITPLGMHNFGIAVNGVPFDPGAAEWYRGQRGSQWQYEALSGAVPLGLDQNNAHVQPSGAYHYHGLSMGLMSELHVSDKAHSPIVGWAADGFPIYALYGFQDAKNAQSTIVEMTSSYQLKAGERPAGTGAPGGRYDGTFVYDYEYVNHRGLLDECNGRFTVTPDFPEGTYAYFLTHAWPFVPRCFRGTVSVDFLKR